jgi:hypothetical protein
MLAFLRRIQSRCFPEVQTDLFLTLMVVADLLAAGPKSECFDTCSQMARFAIAQVRL